MKLNLGAGNSRYTGYTGVDLGGYGADVIHDLTAPLPFPDSSIDEIFASHVVEHFPLWQIQSLLVDWHRVLVDGGTFWGFVPDGPKVVERYLEAVEKNDYGLKRACIANFCGGYTNNQYIPGGMGQIHYCVYDEDLLRDTLGSGGFNPVYLAHQEAGPMDYRLIFVCGKGIVQEVDIRGIGCYPSPPWWQQKEEASA